MRTLARHVLKFSLTCAFICTLPACGTLESGRSWGQDATLFPSQNQLSNAAISSAQHPATWGPLLGAVLFSIGDLDENASEHLADNNPLFGSIENANDISSTFRDALVASTIVTVLAMPSGETGKEHFINKSKGLLIEVAAIEITGATTSLLKESTDRERPNGANNSSFPSGHASRAFAAAALSSKNLDSLSLGANTNTGLRISFYALATGTAWARVEAGVHYITDVMAGAALGNFLSRFIHDAFLGLDSDKQIQIEVMPNFAHVEFKWRFN